MQFTQPDWIAEKHGGKFSIYSTWCKSYLKLHLVAVWLELWRFLHTQMSPSRIGLFVRYKELSLITQMSHSWHFYCDTHTLTQNTKERKAPSSGFVEKREKLSFQCFPWSLSTKTIGVKVYSLTTHDLFGARFFSYCIFWQEY